MTGREQLGPRPLTSNVSRLVRGDDLGVIRSDRDTDPDHQKFASQKFSFSTMELRALEALPWDVVVDGILPRLLERPEGQQRTGLIFHPDTSIKHRPLPTSVELLDRLVALINDWYSDERDEVRSARITDLYMSLLRPHLLLRDLGVVVVPRPRSARHLFLADCDSLCSSDPTLRWTADRQNTEHCMATTLLSSPMQTGKAVVLVASEIQIRGNSLKIFLRSPPVEGYEFVRSVTSTEQAAVASLALVARRGGSRPGPTCGELVRLGKPGYCSPIAYQQTRDALEATRFAMSEIKSLSSTTSVWYTSTTRRGGGNEVEVAVEFPDVMGGLRGGDGDGANDDGELLLTVGACFVGLDFVQHAFFPLRLAVLEDLVKERARSGQAGNVFSRLNRMECSLEVPWAWWVLTSTLVRALHAPTLTRASLVVVAREKRIFA